jgi:hypothetical protein
MMSGCVLCRDMPCCPEHCCNWDECTCGDCEACGVKEAVLPQQPRALVAEPVKITVLVQGKSDRGREEEEKKHLREEEKREEGEEKNTTAAGGGVFGIRALKKKRSI